jgi:hypothetical protein
MVTIKSHAECLLSIVSGHQLHGERLLIAAQRRSNLAIAHKFTENIESPYPRNVFSVQREFNQGMGRLNTLFSISAASSSR